MTPDERSLSHFQRAMLRWVARSPVSSIGRQRTACAAIKETVVWLEVNGWQDMSAGELQQYALWLLERRAAYEAKGAWLS